MSDVPQQRAKLAVLLERLTACTEQLQAATIAYQAAKDIMVRLEQDPTIPVEGLGLTLQLDQASIPLPVPTDGEQRLDLVTNAVNSLGQEVIRLWNVAAAITKDAQDHCAAAAQAAAANAGT